MTDRRTFLLGLGTALAAPAVVRASSLMKIWVPPAPQLITAIDNAEYKGVLYHGVLPVGWYTQKAGRIRYDYDATKACGYTNTGSGDVSVGMALKLFPMLHVAPYPVTL